MLFFFLQDKMCMPEKSGPTQEVLGTRAHLIGIGHAVCQGLITNTFDVAT